METTEGGMKSGQISPTKAAETSRGDVPVSPLQRDRGESVVFIPLCEALYEKFVAPGSTHEINIG
jgi:hypothetical protein